MLLIRDWRVCAIEHDRRYLFLSGTAYRATENRKNPPLKPGVESPQLEVSMRPDFMVMGLSEFAGVEWH